MAMSYDKIKFSLTKGWDDSRSHAPVKPIFPQDPSLVLMRKTRVNASSPLSGKIYLELTDEFQRKLQLSESIDFYKKEVRNNKNVTKIAYYCAGDTVTIWTFVKDFSRKSLYAVYKVEQKLIEKYPSLTFDFTVLISDAEPTPSHFIIETFHNEKS